MPTLVAVSVAPRNACTYRTPIGKHQRADAPAEGKRRRHPEHGDDERRQADLEHVSHGGFEPDFKQENEHADAGQNVDDRIRLDRVEPSKAEEISASQRHASDEFPQHRWLAEANGQVTCEFGGREDDGQGQDDRRDRVGVRCRLVRLFLATPGTPKVRQKKKTDENRLYEHGPQGSWDQPEDGGPTILMPVATNATPLCCRP